MKGFTMKLNNIEEAFKIERASYRRTIGLLLDEIDMLRLGERDHNEMIDDLKDETIDELEAKLKDALAAVADLSEENARLQDELKQCGKKLNAKQYKEYKRLKQNEYQRKWYKNKAKTNK